CVGGALRLRFAGAAVAGEPMRVRFYTSPGMVPYRFSKDEVVLAPGKDGALAAETAITADAWSLASEPAAPRGAVLAAVRSASGDHYAPALFAFDIKTPNAPPRAVLDAKTPLAREYRMLWMERTQGENLALGKPVRFSAAPDYRLTVKGGTDEKDLVDGKLSSRLDDRIWFAADAVGWYMHPTTTYNILIDLGQVQPVDRVVGRFLGGRAGLAFPKSFRAVVSEDGKTFYAVSSLEKLQPGEKDQSDWKSFYFLPEDGVAYVYPFLLPVRTKARYVGLSVTGASGAVFSDEIAVIKGAFDPAAASYAGLEQVSFVTDGVIFRPAKTPLAITTNINTPNFFFVSDCRQAQDAKKPVTCVIELPAEIETLSPAVSGTFTSEAFERDGRAWKRLRLAAGASVAKLKMPPFYFQIAKGASLPKDARAVFYAECEGVAPNRFETPIAAVAVPVVPPLKRLHVSLAWTHEGQMIGWPGFWDAWPALGFNAVSCFPRYWKDGKPSPEVQAFFDDARRRGCKLIYNESPFHVMEGKHKKEKELYSQFKDGTTGSLCPSYRGKFYQEEIRRVADCFAASNADFVFYDIECWYNGAREASRCQVCSDRQKASGKPMADYLATLGPEMWRDMRNAIAAKAKVMGRPMPVIGSYNNHAAAEPHHMVMDFKAAWPQWLDQSQPSLYVRGDARLVHKSIRTNYAFLKKRATLPWLSAGTYGEFEPRLLEHMILEALVNGACGFTYYKFDDFDTPMDFYYQAKALAQIAPCEDLVMDSAPCEVKADNDKLWYSACRKGGEMLILVGNYDRAPNGKATIALPFAKVAAIRDLRAAKTLPAAAALSVDVAPSDIALFYVKGD
ncbi:MAG TPA: discoidin domain-containing protein, partial [Candidatus Brocadiia bacterium]|nr:discoidin domain-containing protein [Candidatus Brocadiia bacterium]